ncbi:uncharacterized protein pot isoform X2 [Atheta coriaria]|uniref:uncharacterized protein pot isoform X2 n=1 Tax=Dalotia coriaria TaxID=877792 RepID=UPI0031F45758
MMRILVTIMVLGLMAGTLAAPQSTYANQANNVEYIGEGLPDQATLDGKVTKLDDLSPVIFLNRTKAALNCAAGSMQVELKFNDRFFGIAYADYDQNSACKVAGKGDHSYKLELPLKGCGTKQDPQRVFTNNIVVRFHPSLQMDVDEIITIVCRYPPPVAPIPAGLPSFIQEDVAPIAALEPPLKGFQILLIICAILFLSLLLLGLGCSYYCLRKRPLTIIRHPLPSVTGSEITKLSGSSLDYPSESHSEIEDVETRSLPVSSAGSYENEAFVQEAVQQIHVPRVPLVAVKEAPTFDVQVRVKRQAPAAPPSLQLSSDSESSVAPSVRNLSTIVEQKEERESIRSLESPQMIERMQFTYVPELHPPPKHVQPAPTYNRILKRQQQELIAKPPPPVTPPEISTHEVDDVFLRTITEKRTIEDIERHKRLVTEFHTRQPDPQKWDVTIKNYPIERPEPPEWENFSDISSTSGMTLTPKPERATMSLPPQTINDNKLPLNSPHLIGNIQSAPRTSTYSEEMSSTRLEHYLEQYQVPLENPEVQNWNVLIRVFQPIEEEGPVIDNAETFNSQLTHADKIKWRQILTTESTLRSKLTEATVREDYERIRQDHRYENLFEPQKWDVIIRVLTPIEKPKQNRYRKKADWDTRSRRSSLPTLYEYDSDGGSSARTLTTEPMLQPQAMRSRKTSRSSYRSDADVRSMSEMIVDFRRQEHDSQSEASSYYPRYGYETYEGDQYNPSLARSLSQPSLARSASEFTERWIAPSRYDTASEFTSPEGTPKSQRSSKIQPMHVPRGQSAAQTSVWQSTTQMRGQAESGRVASATTRQVMSSQQYRSEASTSFMGPPDKNWFGDNDSEASYK